MSLPTHHKVGNALSLSNESDRRKCARRFLTLELLREWQENNENKTDGEKKKKKKEKEKEKEKENKMTKQDDSITKFQSLELYLPRLDFSESFLGDHAVFFPLLPR